MFDRCYNPRCSAFKEYGGRGITVCEHWYIFEQFYEDVGDPPNKPVNYSIDRINNLGNYEPGNVRWATARQQAMNQRATSAKSIIVDGKARISQTEAAERLGVGHASIAKRLAKLRKQGVTLVQFADLKARTMAARKVWADAEKRQLQKAS